MANRSGFAVENEMKTQEQDSKIKNSNKKNLGKLKFLSSHTKEARSDKNSQQRKIELKVFTPKRSPRFIENREKSNLIQKGRKTFNSSGIINENKLSPYVNRIKKKNIASIETKRKKKIDSLKTPENQPFLKLLRLDHINESIAEDQNSVCISTENLTPNTTVSVNIRKRKHLEQPNKTYKLRSIQDSKDNNEVLINTGCTNKNIIIRIQQINEDSSIECHNKKQYPMPEKSNPIECSSPRVENIKPNNCSKNDDESKVNKKSTSLIKKNDIQKITRPERTSLRLDNIHIAKLTNRNSLEETSFKELDETLLVKTNFPRIEPLINECIKSPAKHIKYKSIAVDTSGLTSKTTESPQTFLTLPVTPDRTKIKDINADINQKAEGKTRKQLSLADKHILENDSLKRFSPRLIELKTQKLRSKSLPDNLICKNVGHQKKVIETRNNLRSNQISVESQQQKSETLENSSTKMKIPKCNQENEIQLPTIEQNTDISSNTKQESPSAINFKVKKSCESLLIPPQLKSCNLSPIVVLKRTPEKTIDTQSWKIQGSKDIKMAPANDLTPNRKLRKTGEIKSSTKLKASSESKKIQHKRRRSSFVRGRIKISPMMSYTDLYKDVPVDLPKDQRLFMLCQLAFKFTLGQITASSQDLDINLDFIDKAETTFANCMEKLQSDGVFKEAILPSGSQSTSAETEEMEKMAKYYEVYLDRLKKENETWDNISAKYSDDMNQISVDAEEVSDDILDEEQKALVSQKLNYKELLEELKLMEEKLELRIDAVYKKANYFKRLSDWASALIDDKKKIISANSFAGIKDFLNPQKLLSNVIDSHDLTLPIQPS